MRAILIRYWPTGSFRRAGVSAGRPSYLDGLDPAEILGLADENDFANAYNPYGVVTAPSEAPGHGVSASRVLKAFDHSDLP